MSTSLMSSLHTARPLPALVAETLLLHSLGCGKPLATPAEATDASATTVDMPPSATEAPQAAGLQWQQQLAAVRAGQSDKVQIIDQAISTLELAELSQVPE